MIERIPVQIRGTATILIVEYKESTSAQESGFDAFIDLPFSLDSCKGYPMMHAYFEDMQLSGYNRYCGFIQLIERQEYKMVEGEEIYTINLTIDGIEEMLKAGNPYFCYGYPAEIFDAPCKNLGNCDRLIWKAYTYLVDMPTRINDNKLSYLTGFSWGYKENKSGPQKLLDLEILDNTKWIKHCKIIRSICPEIKM